MIAYANPEVTQAVEDLVIVIDEPNQALHKGIFYATLSETNTFMANCDGVLCLKDSTNKWRSSPARPRPRC